MPKLSAAEQARRNRTSLAANQIRSNTLYALRGALTMYDGDWNKTPEMVSFVQSVHRLLADELYSVLLSNDMIDAPEAS